MYFRWAVFYFCVHFIYTKLTVLTQVKNYNYNQSVHSNKCSDTCLYIFPNRLKCTPIIMLCAFALNKFLSKMCIY